MGMPEKVIVFSRNEAKQHEMRLAWSKGRALTDDVAYQDYLRILEFRIGDVRDYSSVVSALRQVDVVFHAAALKQVPSCEYAPVGAVKANVVAAGNLVSAILSDQ